MNESNDLGGRFKREKCVRSRKNTPSPGGRRENSGTGLGLAIALEAIRQHRGSIVVSNTTPTGLEVKIMLPTRQL